MAAVQLAFSLKTSSNAKTVHLVGSWDSYRGQLPLSKDSSGGSGKWKGTFRFQNATLCPGQRYWYYYIVDGYSCAHDPTREHTVEPTTQRTLNILDVPGGKGSLKVDTSRGSKRSSRDSTSTRRHSRNTPADIPLGRPVSPSRLAHPRPKKPGETRYITMTDFSGHATVDALTRQFGASRLSPASSYGSSSPDGSDIDSDGGSDVPSLTSRSSRSSHSSRSSSSSIYSGSSSPATPYSASSPHSRCSCNVFALDRSTGRKTKLDCGGRRCGAYSSSDDSGSDICNEASSDSEIEDGDAAVRYRVAEAEHKRYGTVVRGPVGLGISTSGGHGGRRRR